MDNLRRKLGPCQANGGWLGWLLIREERAVEVWRGGQEGMAQRLENATRVEGGEAFAGLSLELPEIWAA